MVYNKGKGEAYLWLCAHVNWGGEECLIWPFSCSHSRPRLGYLGKHYSASRMMCEFVNGAPPSPEHEAAHTCGNGHLACVHPQHLVWKTKSENQLDRAAHGTKNTWGCLGKLNQRKADEIRALRGKIPQSKIAVMYGITPANVSLIHCNKAWTGPNRWTARQERVHGR